MCGNYDEIAQCMTAKDPSCVHVSDRYCRNLSVWQQPGQDGHKHLPGSSSLSLAAFECIWAHSRGSTVDMADDQSEPDWSPEALSPQVSDTYVPTEVPTSQDERSPTR